MSKDLNTCIKKKGIAHVQKRGHCPARCPRSPPSVGESSQVLRYGERTASGTAGGRTGVNVDCAWTWQAAHAAMNRAPKRIFCYNCSAEEAFEYTNFLVNKFHASTAISLVGACGVWLTVLCEGERRQRERCSTLKLPRPRVTLAIYLLLGLKGGGFQCAEFTGHATSAFAVLVRCYVAEMSYLSPVTKMVNFKIGPMTKRLILTEIMRLEYWNSSTETFSARNGGETSIQSGVAFWGQGVEGESDMERFGVVRGEAGAAPQAITTVSLRL